MKIERRIFEIRTTDDLSYSKMDSNSGVNIQQTPSGKQLIDRETLMRLIDDCREDKERLSVMSDH